MRLLKIAIMLSACLLQNFAFAGPVGSNPLTAMKLVDDYLARVAHSPQSANFQTLAEVGRSEYLADRVILQIERLVPADFNLFLYSMLERYVQSPDDRAALSQLLTMIRDSIKDELDTDAQTKHDGPSAAAIEGTWRYGQWISLGIAVFSFRFLFLKYRGIYMSTNRSAAFLAQLKADMKVSVKTRVARWGQNIAINGLASAGTGALLGTLAWELDNNSTHKLDPVEMLNVVQANLACAISWQAAQLRDDFAGAKLDDDEFKKKGPTFVAPITKLMSEGAELVKEYPLLGNLDVKDPLYNQKVQDVPKAKNWQEFKKLLTTADQSGDGKCRAMALDVVVSDLASDLMSIPEPEDKKEVKPDTTKKTPSVGEKLLNPNLGESLTVIPPKDAQKKPVNPLAPKIGKKP